MGRSGDSYSDFLTRYANKISNFDEREEIFLIGWWEKRIIEIQMSFYKHTEPQKFLKF
ncbi:MAG: hypothetical protein CM15mP12_0650 [Gammaproteobacteria bacterium]|nr:MAG: hypothetical protein CM15mP12_0650 [Gammaproteobacteria bacterium]